MIDPAASTPGTGGRNPYSAILVGLFLVMAGGAVALIIFKLQRQPAFVDYLVMWTGGRLAWVDPKALYDFVKVDKAQAWLLGARAHDRPFPYPPSALLVFAPLARLPFWISAWTWSTGGLAIFALGVWGLARRRQVAVLALALVLPGAVWAGLSGQCAFVVGGLAILALVDLERRPMLAGVAIGLAMALKPTLLLMAPVALIAGGHWRALTAMAMTGAAAVALSLALFGSGPWVDWLTVAPSYLAKISGDPRYSTAIIAPTGLALRLGVHGGLLTLCRVVFAVGGALLTWRMFRNLRASPAIRLIALVGGSLLATPYAMNYETALLAPAAALALIEADGPSRRAMSVIAYLTLALAGLPNVGVFAFPLFLAVSLWPIEVRRLSIPPA